MPWRACASPRQQQQLCSLGFPPDSWTRSEVVAPDVVVDRLISSRLRCVSQLLRTDEPEGSLIRAPGR
jgi:hypothetical protein